MPREFHCAVINCSNSSRIASRVNGGVSYHQFPNDPKLKEKWINATGNKNNWFPNKHSKICSIHFKDDVYYGSSKRRLLYNSAIPTIDILQSMSEGEVQEHQPAQTQPTPGPSTAPRAITSDDISPDEQDLSRVIEQCRFCGDFRKRCISVSNMLHCSEDRTTLVFNNLVVQIDFNDDILPKTICPLCHKKLQEMHDFVTVVKNAQKSLAKLEVEEVYPLEMLIIKQEYEDSDDDNNADGNGCQPSNDEDNNIEGDKDIDCDSSNADNHHKGIENDSRNKGKLDSLIVSKTTFDKKTGAQKRKIDISENNSKKARVIGSESDEYQEIIIEIKEEVIENDNDVSDVNNTDIGETRTDKKPSEVALASSLVFRMSYSSDEFH